MKRREMVVRETRVAFVERAFALIPLTSGIELGLQTAIAVFEATTARFPKEYQRDHFILPTIDVWLTRLDQSANEQG